MHIESSLEASRMQKGSIKDAKRCEMAKVDLQAALKAMEPDTKAAQMRSVMPIIEAQLRAGVKQQAILDVLKSQGIELNMPTFKNYLYRYRKSLKAGMQTAEPARAETPRRVEKEPISVSYDTENDTDTEPTNTVPVAPSALSKIMNPGDDVNASEMARYESAGKKRRKP